MEATVEAMVEVVGMAEAMVVEEEDTPDLLEEAEGMVEAQEPATTRCARPR